MQLAPRDKVTRVRKQRKLEQVGINQQNVISLMYHWDVKGVAKTVQHKDG